MLTENLVPQEDDLANGNFIEEQISKINVSESTKQDDIVPHRVSQLTDNKNDKLNKDPSFIERTKSIDISQ